MTIADWGKGFLEKNRARTILVLALKVLRNVILVLFQEPLEGTHEVCVASGVEK